MSYEFTDEMREISGFGGGYEANCRAMLRGGLEWWDAHPEAGPKFTGLKGVLGLVSEDNDDARALSDAMLAATSEGDTSTAAHQFVLSHIFFVRENGWDAYIADMS